MKYLIASLTVVTSFVWGYNAAALQQMIDNDLKDQQTSTAQQLQPAERGTKLQTTTSDAYLQWGHNPQKTINGKVLQGGL